VVRQIIIAILVEKKFVGKLTMIDYVNKDWGYEEFICNTDKYCGKFLIIERGYQTSIHYHKIKDELFYVMDGVVGVLFQYTDGRDEQLTILVPGDTLHIPTGQIHRLIAAEGNVRVLEISTHHEDSDSIRLELGGKIPLI
jgi:mannose-6-phosphate isomerase-like protein (cupin superfamily)